MKVPWGIRYRFWHSLHCHIASINNRFNMEPGWKWGNFGCALHHRKGTKLAKLNHWVGRQYIPEWIVRTLKWPVDTSLQEQLDMWDKMEV